LIILRFYHRHFIVMKIAHARRSRVFGFALMVAPYFAFVVEISLTTTADWRMARTSRRGRREMCQEYVCKISRWMDSVRTEPAGPHDGDARIRWTTQPLSRAPSRMAPAISAIGASPLGVIWLVVREGMLLTTVGLTAGLAGALAAVRWIHSLLFGVTPADPATFAGVACALTVAAVLATYVPARRAASVDPTNALRID
jgi:hypothetical protein